MEDILEYDQYPMECYTFGYNCTEFKCWNITYPTNCTGMYVSVDQDISFWQIPQLVILILLFVFIVFGNTCVLVAIGLSETGRKTRMNFFIMNLAIADLFVGIFHVTIDIAEKCLIAWYGGTAMCKIIRYFQVFVIYASTFMIVSLSIDRVDAIARPMNFTRKAMTVRALVYAAWIVSGVLSLPSLLLFDTAKVNDVTYCIIKLQERWQWQVYLTLIALTAFIIPALIIVACYTIIIGVIWDKGRGFSNTFSSTSCRSAAWVTMRRRVTRRLIGIQAVSKGHQSSFSRTLKEEYLSKPDSYGPLMVTLTSAILTSMFEEVEMQTIIAEPNVRQHTERTNKGIIPQAKIRTFKMTLIIVCVFVLSWCPYFVFNLMDVYEDPSNKSMTQLAVTSLIQSLAPLNSAANPIIYGAFSTRICNNLRRVPCVAEMCNWLFQCRTNRLARNSLRGTNASHTDQTYVDAASGKNKRHIAANGRRLTCDNETSNLVGQGHCPTSNQCVYKVKDNCCKLITKPKGFHSRRPSGLPLVNRKMSLQDTIILETYRISTENSQVANNSLVRQSSSTSDDTSHASQTVNGLETNGVIVEEKCTILVRNDNGPIFEEPSNFVL